MNDVTCQQYFLPKGLEKNVHICKCIITGKLLGCRCNLYFIHIKALEYWHFLELLLTVLSTPPVLGCQLLLKSTHRAVAGCWVYSSLPPTAASIIRLWLGQPFKIICIWGLIGPYIILQLKHPIRNSWNIGVICICGMFLPQHSKQFDVAVCRH